MHRLKRFFSLFWQVFLFPILFVPYFILLDMVIVEWLGCGSAPLFGEPPAFSANQFTWLFWGAVGLAVVGISAFSMRKIKEPVFKAAYLLGILLVSGLLTVVFSKLMMFQ